MTYAQNHDTMSNELVIQSFLMKKEKTTSTEHNDLTVDSVGFESRFIHDMKVIEVCFLVYACCNICNTSTPSLFLSSFRQTFKALTE